MTPSFNRWEQASRDATADARLADVAEDQDRQRAADRERAPVWFAMGLAAVMLGIGKALGYAAHVIWEWVG